MCYLVSLMDCAVEQKVLFSVELLTLTLDLRGQW